ncbi:MAG TPA: GNAT family N-acetyltransferase [Solirubrobacteraceae bacterium]|nr:GNAT family N-acetyltransferase [Solirubrobacteraceae bacterium]
MRAPAPTIVLRPARNAAERSAATDLRIRVFCDEQGVSREDEIDGRDGDALHLVALERGAVVGTCRLLFDGTTCRLGRLVVDRAARRRGIGGRLLGLAEAEARSAGAERIVLNAQTRARGVYRSAGYTEGGETFMSAGIEHIRMERALA